MELAAMDGINIIGDETQIHTLPTLPHDMIEDILSRLSVKHLFRFKAVSKEWKATISDPKFAEIHRRRSNHKYLLAWEADDLEKLHVVKPEPDKFRILSMIRYPPDLFPIQSTTYYPPLRFWRFPTGEHWRSDILCDCDGLLLHQCGNPAEKMFLLWNPSNRTYKTFQCPHSLDLSSTINVLCVLLGISYDPSTMDYKVLISNTMHYAVFSCRNNGWSELKEYRHHSLPNRPNGLSYNGYTFWAMHTISDDYSSLLCFDWRDEKFKIPAVVDSKGRAVDCYSPLILYSSGDELTMVAESVRADTVWIQLKVEPQVSCPRYVCPICLIDENEMIFDKGRELKSLKLYDKSIKTSVGISAPTGLYSGPVPYKENLFLLQDN